MKINQMHAYALGYYHGRIDGVERKNTIADALVQFYILGFEAGVAEYCLELEEQT